MRQASRSYPHSLSPSTSHQHLSPPATPRTPSYTTCYSPVLRPAGLNSPTTTPTKRTPSTSTATHSPRQRICTPSNKLTPQTQAQPTLAMSILAPTPRSPQPRSSPHQATRSPSVARPSSRSECLLRDTLRRDDTLRTTATVRARSRSRSACSDCDEDDEDFFQSGLLFRSSSRRNSATSATSQGRARNNGATVLVHGQTRSFYVPDENEHTSYAQLLRSSSFSGSSRSRKSEPRSQYISFAKEKQEDPSLSRSFDAAPHEAVLRTRLDHVIHRGMREIRREKEKECGTSSMESSTGSPPSSLCSLSNSRSNSHESEQTHLTVPESDACLPSTPPPLLRDGDLRGRGTLKGHRHTQSMSATQLPVVRSPHRDSTRVPPQSPRTPQLPRSQPQTPRSREQQKQKHIHPDSPWLSTPLPPSPPAFPTTPSKRAGPVVATIAASHSALIYETHTHLPPRSPHPRSPHSSPAFDPEAASLACKQVPGYVSFASVAGLGAPPEEEERRSGRKGFAGFNIGGGGGKGRGLGFGTGKWWVF